MQCWFFLEDELSDDLLEEERRRSGLADGRGDGPDGDGLHLADMKSLPPKAWLFRVSAAGLQPGEAVFISGECAELGAWDPEKAKPLAKAGTDTWQATINIPDCHFGYRYFVAFLDQSTDARVVVRRWETQPVPRVVDEGEVSPSPQDEPDVFGEYFDDRSYVQRGWLLHDSLVQLKLIGDPLVLWEAKYAKRVVHVKVSPVSLVKYQDKPFASMAEALEDSLSTDTPDLVEAPKYAVTEVFRLRSNHISFDLQDQFGAEYRPSEMLIFQINVLDLQNTAYLVDFYVYSSRAAKEDPPHHVGFAYILPSALSASEGHLVLPVASVKQRPMGQLELDYLVVRPMPEKLCNLSVSYAKYWKISRSALDVGHRGLGTSFKGEPKNCAEVRENTIASLKTAASHGADYVEFDVQLSKDLVPVIYHDFHVCIAMKKKKELEDSDMMEVPVKDLTVEQLHFFKVYHLMEAKPGASRTRFFDDNDLEEHQPFPTLETVLHAVNPIVGFNIEIKANTRLMDDSNEVDTSIDMNLYLDIIVKTVLQHGDKRRIIFSSFNPDVCCMLRWKQNKYPVMFLTQGQTQRYKPYKDPRCLTIEAAADFSIALEILGINVHTEDVLRDPSQLKAALERNVIAFCWGEDNNNAGNIKHLKQLGLHGVIYDKMNELKDVKESIFVLEARESQKQIVYNLAPKRGETALAATTTAAVSQAKKQRFMDVESARRLLPAPSTATSFSSLQRSSDAATDLPDGADKHQEELQDSHKAAIPKSRTNPPKSKGRKNK